MVNRSISGTLDSVFLKGEGNRIFMAIEFFEDLMEMPQHIAVDITDIVQKIYPNVILDNTFVQGIKNKIEKNLGEDTITIMYSNQNSWVLNMGATNLFI